MPFPEEKLYTIEDIYALPDGKRGELIDGKLYMMAPPSRIHQKILQEFSRVIGNYIWIIEIVSPSSQRMDYLTKLLKYRTAGVREFWIVNPMKETVQAYSFEGTEDSTQYSFSDLIESGIFEDLRICITDMLK